MAIEKSLKEKVQSRKFVLTIAFLLVATYYFNLGQLDSEIWVNACLWVIGIYSGVNVGQQAVHRFSSQPTSIPTSSESKDEVMNGNQRAILND